MSGAPSHRKAVAAIAQKMGLPQTDVDHVIGALFSTSGLYMQLRAPLAVNFPYIGNLVPDMRVHRHLLRREKKVKYINDSRKRKRIARQKKK